MSAARPPEGARPLLQEGVREVHEVTSLGEAPMLAARPPEGARPLLQEGVREVHEVTSLGEEVL
jgi:hypothetical protein